MRLKEMRIKNNMFQKDVADYLGVERTTYVRYETGAIEPNIDTLNRLADLYGVSVDYLLGRDAADLIDNADAFSYAMFTETKDLSEESKKTLLDMVEFLKKKDGDRQS